MSHACSSFARPSFFAGFTAALFLAACGETSAGAPPVTSAAGVGTTYTTELALSSTSWRNVSEGDLTLIRIDAPDSFGGELACHSSPSRECGSGTTSEAEHGPKIFTRRAPSPGEIIGDGAVPAGHFLCCGAVSGAGGKVTVSYMK